MKTWVSARLYVSPCWVLFSPIACACSPDALANSLFSTGLVSGLHPVLRLVTGVDSLLSPV